MPPSRKYRKRLRARAKAGSRRVQRGGNKQTIVVFDFTNYAGFFSQFWFLCQAYIYAKNNKYPFYVNSSKWNYTSKDGWHDYFTSLKEYKDDGSDREIKRYAHFNNIGIPTYKIADYVQAVKEIYAPNAHIDAKVQAYVKENGSYNSIYIRRGDKKIDNTMDPIKDLIGHTDLKDDGSKLFVQTDDYAMIKELQDLLPSVEILTTTPKEKHGSHSTDIIMMSPEKRKGETEEFLVSIGIFLAGKNCWTDIRSNVGRFHKFAAFDRVKYYPDYKDVDINKETMPQYSI